MYESLCLENLAGIRKTSVSGISSQLAAGNVDHQSLQVDILRSSKIYWMQKDGHGRKNSEEIGTYRDQNIHIS